MRQSFTSNLLFGHRLCPLFIATAAYLAEFNRNERRRDNIRFSPRLYYSSGRLRSKAGRFVLGAGVLLEVILGGLYSPLLAGTAPSAYSAYTGTDTKTIPPAPALGAANSVINDPTFGSPILRVTDQSTQGGESFISTDSGFHRTWNADSTAIKLTGPTGDGYWLEFNPNTFKVGDGSTRPVIHQLPFGASWEWSTVDPDVIYFPSGSLIGKYNKSTGLTTYLGGPPNGDPVAYMAVVIGLDNWVCAAAGSGSQDSYTEIFCINPSSPSTSKFIDIYNKTINGIPQNDPNWPTSAPGQVIGIHDVSGGTGASWLEVTFHQQSWGANGGAVFNLAANTWSRVTSADPYWSGHVSMGNGAYLNSSGSTNGKDSRGMVARNPGDLMNSAEYLFLSQPPDTFNNWCDADHSSWLNSVSNPNAPVLISRYTVTSPCSFAWAGEIIAAAVDGSNTVWRFAHNHNQGSSCYYAQSFAQISNDGNWALFSSSWDGTLGPDTSFGCATRIDTFIVSLSGWTNNPANPSATTASTGSTTNNTGTATTNGPSTTTSSGGGSTPTASGSASTTRTEQDSPAVNYSGNWLRVSNGIFSSGSAAEAMDAGSQATFTFTGVGVRWIGYRDEWSGMATVYLDGQLQSTVDTYATPNQAQSVIWSATGLLAGSHTLTITVTGTHDGSSAGSWIWIDAFDVEAGSSALPAILTLNSQGTGQGAIEIANSSIIAAPQGSIPGAQTRPANIGEFITIYGTGLGAVTNPPASGAPASANPLSTTINVPQVTIGGIPASVSFSGLTPDSVGLYQVNVQVPTGVAAGDAVPVVLAVGGNQTNTVSIAVSQP